MIDRKGRIDMDNNYQNNYQNNFQSPNPENTPPQQDIPPYAQQMNQNFQNDSGLSAKPKKKKPVWVTRCILGVLICAIAFGGGYAGASLAYQNVDRIVVERVSAPAESGGSVPAGTSLTSEEVAAKVEPTVVAIMTEQMTTSNFWFGQQVSSGAGSGVIISEDGYIVTCDHVIEGADTVQVQLSDGSVYDAEVVGQYVENDIAVIKIDATGLTPAMIADSDAVVQGETVYAVGNPEGQFSGSITDGLISAVDRSITMQLTTYDNDDSSGNTSDNTNRSTGNSLWDYFYGGSMGNSGNTSKTIQTVIKVFQTSAPVSPGNSGGGLFNANGELIGIVNAKSSDSDAEGLGFAIPINKAMEIANALMTEGSYTPSADEQQSQEGSTTQQNTNKAMLGIKVATLTAQEAAQYGYTSAGVYIVEITEQATADAGLAVGDRIISVDDVIANQLSDVTGYLADKAPGDTVTVTIERSGKMLSVDVTLLENPDAAD